MTIEARELAIQRAFHARYRADERDHPDVIRTFVEDYLARHQTDRALVSIMRRGKIAETLQDWHATFPVEAMREIKGVIDIIVHNRCSDPLPDHEHTVEVVWG